MRVLQIAFLLLLAAPMVRADDLDTPPGHMPYDFSEVLHVLHSAGSAHRQYLAADVNHDGFDEIIQAQATGLIAMGWDQGVLEVCWQFNVPARFQAREPAIRLGASFDLDDDGWNEILAIGDAGDTGEWRLWVYDPVASALRLDVPLVAGSDVNGDGRWDGDYEIAALLPGPDPLVILACEVRFDRYGRGLRAHDLRTGREVWRHEMGNNVNPDLVRVADLDGDGRSELIVGGSAPDNLGGELVNGTSDDAAYVRVLDADGVELWRRRVSGHFSMAHVETADLDHDGRIEVLTATNTHAVGQLDHLSIWDGVSGELLGQRNLPGRARDLLVLPGTGDEDCRVAIGGYDGGIHVYRWDGERLGREREVLAEQGLVFLRALDVLPEPGLELFAGTRSGRTVVLTPELRVLASWLPDPPAPSWVHAAHVEDGVTLLCCEGPVARIRRYEASSFAWWDRLPGLAVLAALVILAAVGLRAGRSRVADAVLTELPRPDQRRLLLQELELSGHGAVAATRSLRRYVWLLESVLQGGDNRLKLLVRIGRTGEDLLQEDLPRLVRILDLARATRQDAKLVEVVSESLQICRRTIERLSRRNHADAPVAEALDPLRLASERVEQGLLTLRTAAESYYRVDACRIIGRVLMVREDELAGAGITVRSERTEDRLPCRIDPGSLRFVIDNLIGNALESMRSDGGGELVVCAFRQSGLVTITVTDSGCGIDPGDAERIFQAGFTSRPGGGMGLYRSREFLREWGGDVTLVRSEPGLGSTFMLRLVSLEEEPR